MKTFCATILSVFLLVNISCNRPERVFSPKNQETPKALQEENMIEEVSSFSKRGKGDLIDELYSEQVNKNPELKEIETLVSNSRQNEVEVVNEFETYEGKSSRFYNSAKNHINNISDSVLKAKMLALINESEAKYKNHSAKLTFLENQIKTNSNSISDYQEALKVIVSIPVIEKYQRDNLPQDSLYRRIIGDQQKIVRKMRKVVEK